MRQKTAIFNFYITYPYINNQTLVPAMQISDPSNNTMPKETIPDILLILTCKPNRQSDLFKT